MGLLNSGFAAGAAGAFQDVAKQQIATWTAQDVARERELMEIAHEKRIEQMQIRQEDRLQERRDAPAKRFSGLLHSKLGEEVPVEPAAATSTTAESAQAIGKQDGLQGDVAKIRAQLTAALNDPTRSEETKQQAREALAQLDEQVRAQQGINAKAVEGKTRKRSFDEAVDAAREVAASSDPAAFMAGESMFANDRKDAREERKLGAQAKLKEMEINQRDRETSRKEKADEQRYEAMMARIESGFGGKKGQATALIQNIEYLRDTLKWTPDQINNFVTDKKGLPVEDIAARLLASDKFGELTPEAAMEKAMALETARQKYQAGSKSAGAQSSTDPLGLFRK